MKGGGGEGVWAAGQGPGGFPWLCVLVLWRGGGGPQGEAGVRPGHVYVEERVGGRGSLRAGLRRKRRVHLLTGGSLSRWAPSKVSGCSSVMGIVPLLRTPKTGSGLYALGAGPAKWMRDSQ